MIFLSDLDGVGAEWDGRFDHHATTKWAHVPGIPLRHERTSFAFYDLVDDETRVAILEIMNLPDFYEHLEPVPGWIEAMHEIAAAGHEVFIVTTPWWTTENCTRDKLNWVARHLGEEWRKRVILTGDKTLVQGDILVDDKPQIHGVGTPSWTHVIYEQPYNAPAPGSRIKNWTDGSWRDVIQSVAA